MELLICILILATSFIHTYHLYALHKKWRELDRTMDYMATQNDDLFKINHRLISGQETKKTSSFVRTPEQKAAASQKRREWWEKKKGPASLDPLYPNNN
jgi:hypothetical protein